MKRVLVVITMFLSFPPGPVTATTYPASYDKPHHATFDNILRASVRGERVDYELVRRTNADPLGAYLDELADKRVELFPRDHQLAYYINLYNATMLKAVLDRQAADPAWTPAAEDFAVFKLPLVRLRGRVTSLNDLEHQVIRKQFKDPRVHAALNCAAESCPPLLSRAYRADDLDAVLEENMRRFVNDPVRNPIDLKNRKLVVSQIFEWYADDFGGRDQIDEYIDRYHDADTTGWPVSFVEYSWELNDATPAG